MAAPSKSSQEADCDSSSGEEEEDLERLREAAWEPPGSLKKNVPYPENSASSVPSLRSLKMLFTLKKNLCGTQIGELWRRVRPDSHEHDGNELQTTPEFRTHVAKKLAAMLDGCIKEIPRSNPFNQKATAASDSEDEGFRLLTTSVPGDSGEILPSRTVKRRPVPSTSEDSEEEQRRCREAAVSVLDILGHSALQTTPVEIMDMANNNQSKKKKKKKAKKERGLSDETETDDQNMESEGKINGCKKKKKTESRLNINQAGDQTVHLESKKESKKSKAGSDCPIKSKTVKDGSKKKEMGLGDGAASDQNINQTCGKSGTKKKKKVIVENCDEHDEYD